MEGLIPALPDQIVYGLACTPMLVWGILFFGFARKLQSGARNGRGMDQAMDKAEHELWAITGEHTTDEGRAQVRASAAEKYERAHAKH